MKDVVIIGGGVAGLGAALTLGSSEGSKRGRIETLVIDNGKSDLKKAELHNVPFVKKGTSGVEALEQLKKDALEFSSVEFVEDSVLSIEGEAGDFTIKGEKTEVKSKFIVLATGAHELNIILNGKKIPTETHELMPKDGMIKISFNGRQKFKEGIFIAGLLSGVTTMYATALGSGVEAACAILSEIGGKTVIVHDFKGSRDKK